MRDSETLRGETVIFTGTSKSKDVFEIVEQYGGKPVSLPLIVVSESVESTDLLRLEACPTYDWLIFTSQTAVDAFEAKIKRHNFNIDTITGRIAAIGTRTAAALEKIGFTVDFIPTVFSADVFVKEFAPVENNLRRILFLKGSIAGATITEELPFEVDDWTVYKTEKETQNTSKLISILQGTKNVSVLFASPSAVNIFAEDVVPITGWNDFTVGAIGHITERALVEVGAKVHVKPTKYTLKDLVDTLANGKDVTSG